jgi:hypothetical protein
VAINYERKPVNFIGSIIRPLSAKINADANYVLSVPSEETISFVVVPKAYLVSTTSVTKYLTLKTSLTAETVTITIATSTTVINTSLLLTIYQDVLGNIYSK